MKSILRHRQFARLLVFCIPITVGLPEAAAAPRGSATKSTEAMRLYQQAQAAMQARQHAQAEELLVRAASIEPGPQWALERARVLADSGQFIKARKVLETIGPTTRSLDGTTTAAIFLTALELRIPSLVLQVSGPPPGRAKIHVDQKPEPDAARGIRLDPGMHEIEVVAEDFYTAVENVELLEGERKSLRIPLTPRKQEVGVTGSSSPWATWHRPAAIASWVVSAGGLTTGLLYWHKKSNTEGDDASTAQKLSVIGFSVAVVSAGAGAAFWLTAPDSSTQTTTGIVVGPSAVSLVGSF